MNSIEKNTVSAENQINVKFRTQFIGSDTPDKKVLILGNSITYHGEKADIGWHGNWGMAASNPENDYVHLLYKKSKELCPKVQFCVVQISSFEADFCNIELMKEYEIIKNYAPDIVVLRFGENIKSGKYDLTKLNQSYDYFVKNYLVSSKAYLRLNFYRLRVCSHWEVLRTWCSHGFSCRYSSICDCKDNCRF